MTSRKRRSQPSVPMARRQDRHALYEAAVQHNEGAVAFMNRRYRKLRGNSPLLFREDFCGTAALSCAWVRSRSDRRAWGIDLDRGVLDWARRHNLPALGSAGERLALLEADVLEARTPRADIVAAFNFSYFIFKQRSLLKRYFRRVRRTLAEGGLFFLDLYGGASSMKPVRESRTIAAEETFGGIRTPRCTYTWEQASFDALTHTLRCHIHFRFRDGSSLPKAFSYDWRLWTLPELRDLLAEAGFPNTDVFIHGWTPAGDSDDRFRLRKHYRNEEGWIAYLAAY